MHKGRYALYELKKKKKTIRKMESLKECSLTSKDVSLQELKQRLKEFARVRGWEQYHSPRNLLLALVSPLN